MRIAKRVYEIIDMTGTTTAEAIGIARYAIMNYRSELFEKTEQKDKVKEFLNWGRSFDCSFHLLEDRELGDQHNRGTEDYCVRLVMNCYSYDFTSILTRYYINMRAETSSGLPAIKLVVQEEEEPEKEKSHISFITLGSIYLDEDDVSALLETSER